MNSYWPGTLPEPSILTLNDMRCVLANPDQSGSMLLYYMYRDLALTAEDRAYLNKQNVRFDITIIPPGTVGGEYVKTKGHYHPLSPSGIGYPELYQVLAGEALYLLQRSDLGDIVAVTAKAGEFVLIPPGYDHQPRHGEAHDGEPGLGRLRERIHVLRADAGRSVLPDGGRWVGAELPLPDGSPDERDPCRGGA